MSLHNLSNVHAMRYTQGCQNDVYGCAIRQEGHVLHWQDARNDSFVAVTPRHFIANADLMLASYTDTNRLIDSRRQFVSPVAREDFHINDFAVFTMRHTQR